MSQSGTGAESVLEKKTRDVLRKSYRELPVAKDLPRLASRIKVEDLEGRALLAPLGANAGPSDHLLNLFRTLTLAIEGEDAAKRVEKEYHETFTHSASTSSADGSTTNTLVDRILETKLDGFISRVLGGDESRVVQLLKTCNQSAIAGAVIELKVALGVSNTTKDVPNSWVFVITVPGAGRAGPVQVRNHKREQALDGLFTFEWVLSFAYADTEQLRPGREPPSVMLRVVDLAFSPAIAPEKMQEVEKALGQYYSEELTGQKGKSSRLLESDDARAISREILSGEHILLKDRTAQHLHALGQSAGLLFLTNYRLLFEPETRRTAAADGLARHRAHLLALCAQAEVPLASVLLLKRKGQQIHVWCKDLRMLRFQFPRAATSRDQVYEALQRALPSHPSQLFAFHHVPPHRLAQAAASWAALPDAAAELRRMRVPLVPSQWRVSAANADYVLSSALPRTLVVPALASDEDLRRSAEHRARGRVPCLAWRAPSGQVLLRAGSPLSSQRCLADERLLLEVARLNPNREPLQVLEVSSRTRAASAIEACRELRLECLDLPPVSALRDSFARLARLLRESPASGCAAADEDSDWLPSLAGTRWLSHLQGLLAAASRVADHLERGRSVLLQEPDAPDRVPQLASLAQLLLDPACRSLAGFEALVEREWVQGGHRFADRCGHLHGTSAGSSSDQQAPVFLQFVEALRVLMLQFPDAFEFTPAYLVELMQQVYACLHGNFLANSEQEREQLQVSRRTASLWADLRQRADLRNPRYHPPGPRVLVPSISARRLTFWHEYYLRHEPDLQPVSAQDPAAARNASGSPPDLAQPAAQQLVQALDDKAEDLHQLLQDNRRLLKELEIAQFELQQLRAERERERSSNTSAGDTPSKKGLFAALGAGFGSIGKRSAKDRSPPSLPLYQIDSRLPTVTFTPSSSRDSPDSSRPLLVRTGSSPVLVRKASVDERSTPGGATLGTTPPSSSPLSRAPDPSKEDKKALKEEERTRKEEEKARKEEEKRRKEEEKRRKKEERGTREKRSGSLASASGSGTPGAASRDRASTTGGSGLVRPIASAPNNGIAVIRKSDDWSWSQASVSSESASRKESSDADFKAPLPLRHS